MLADTSVLRCNSKCDPQSDPSDGSGTLLLVEQARGGAGGRSRGVVMITLPLLAAGVVHTIIVSAKPYIYMTERKLL